MTTPDQLIDRTRDPLDVLASASPTPATLERDWTSVRSEAALRATLRHAASADPSSGHVRALTPRRSRRRWVALGAAAAVAALASLGAVTVLAPEAALPKADAVEQLARTAALAPSLELGAGEYIHHVVHVTQRNSDAQTPAVDLTSESWVDAEGTTWRRDVSRTDPVGTTYHRLPASDLGDDPFQGTQPSDYLKWPTEPTALRTFFDAHIRSDGLNALDASQSIFEDCSDRFTSGTTPPRLNAALIRLLGSLPQVTTSRVQFAGRQAVELEYRGAYVNALYFDEQTAAYLGETAQGERTVAEGAPGVVDALPREVRDRAVTEGNDDATAANNASASNGG